MHLTSEEGCFFSMVDCPLTDLGCTPHTVQRKDLSKHTADKYSTHMKIIVERHKHISARLNLQQTKISELKATLPKNLSHSLDEALSDTVPALWYVRKDGSKRSDMSLNGSRLHGLREIEGRGTRSAVVDVSHDKGCGTVMVEVGVTEHGSGMGELETEGSGGEGEEPKRVMGSPTPLFVQLYRATCIPASSTPRVQVISSGKTLKLFVKHLGTDMTTQEITDLFSSSGKVYEVQKHPTRRTVAYVYMCQEGGKKAIAGLNGYQARPTSKPLLVEHSFEPKESDHTDQQAPSIHVTYVGSMRFTFLHVCVFNTFHLTSTEQ